MSLLTDAMERCVMLDKSRRPDGQGGYKTEWTEGLEFDAAITHDSTLQAKVAAKQGVTSLYTITVAKSVPLEYHDVIRRKSDGKIIRITSDGDDVETPRRATMQLRQVSGEEWVLV